MQGLARWGVYPAATGAPTAACDLFEFVEPGTGLLWIPRFKVWQSSDLGDAAEEMITLEWIIGFTVSGSGGQTTNIAAYNKLYDSADTFTAEALNTTLANTTATRTPWAGGMNIRVEYNEILLPEGAQVLRDGERGVLRMSAPADALTMRCWAEAVQG